MASAASFPERLSSTDSHSSEDDKLGIPLNQVVAVARLEDGRPIFSIEVSYLDESIGAAGSLLIQLSDPREADIWLSSIKAAAIRARLIEPTPIPPRAMNYISQCVGTERDYDPDHFQAFRVVLRLAVRSDDPTKSVSLIRYMAIGAHKVHFLPVQEAPRKGSNTASSDGSSSVSYGIMTLISIIVKPADDGFELVFR